MYKTKLLSGNAGPTARLAAVVGLSALLLPIQNIRAQQCDTGLGSSIGLSVPAGTPVHIGDVINVTTVTVFNGPTTCEVEQGDMYLIKPDNSAQLAADEFHLNAGFNLPGGSPDAVACSGVASGTCVAFNGTYTVTFADINKPLTFTTTKNGLTFNCNAAPVPKNIQFELAAVGVALPAGSGNASACNTRPLEVIFPCISITKECVNPCTVRGQPIQFRGTITNSGDTPLFNIVVTDTPAATINIAATTTQGNPFPPNGAGFAPGDSVTYTGSYTPTGNPCGPFTDTIQVTAQDVTGLQISNLSPCINPQTGVSTGPRAPVTATCLVCDAPCIDVTKTCDATAAFGQPVAYQVVVRNCSENTPLTGVTVTDSIAGQIIGPIDLAPGASQTFNGTHAANTIPNNGCGPLVDTVTATGNDICSAPVTDTATCTTTITRAPGISVTKTCGTATITLGQSYTVSGEVCNTGNTPLSNVVVMDSLVGQVFGPATLAVGQCLAIPPRTITPTVCAPSVDTFTATATDQCGASVTDTSDTCTTQVVCPPCIEVTKEIACAEGDLNTCPAAANYGETATGVLGDDPNAFPHFCYRIRVTNCGQVALTGVTLTDPTLQITENIGNLAIGASTSFFHYMRGWGVDTLNTATATGVSAVTQETVTDTDTAQAIVLNASLTCEKLVAVNGGTPAATLELPGGGPHLVTFYARVTNTGEVPLNVTISDPACTEPVELDEPLDAGATSDLIEICTVEVTCPDGLVNTMTVTGTVAQPDQGPQFCDLDGTGQPITASSTCTATITCRAQAGCTPGFWKNCTVHWGPTGYQLTDFVQDVFPNVATCCPALGGNKTLLQALSFKGGAGDCGGAGNLLRAGVAALLNASSTEVDYPRTEADVLADVNEALGGCDRNTMLQLAGDLDADNNLGCRGANGEGLPCKVIR